MKKQRQALIEMKKHMEYWRDSVKMFFQNPVSQMTIYCYHHGMTPKFCDSEEEVAAFKASNKVSFVMPYVAEYIGTFAGRTDVFKKTRYGQVTYCTPIDSEHYEIYDPEQSKNLQKHVWETVEGSQSEIYDAFRERGIVFENDIYQKFEEEEQQLILYMKKTVKPDILSKTRPFKNVEKN